MRAISGVLVVDHDHRQSGSATISFCDIPHDGAAVGNARIGRPRAVGGSGVFRQPPAFVVHPRQWVRTESAAAAEVDRGFDEYIVDTRSFEDRLVIDWDLPGGAQIEELAFLVVGD